MQVEPTPQHEELAPPVDVPSLLLPSFSSAVIDRTEDWGRRRLLGVSSVTTSVDRDALHADGILDEIATVFFRHTFAPIDTALETAIEATARSQTPQLQDHSRPVTIGMAVAAIEGSRLIIAVERPCLALLAQDGQVFALPDESILSDRIPTISRGSQDIVIYETTVDESDRLALLAAMGPVEDPGTLIETGDPDTLSEVAGPQGAFVWIETGPEAGLQHPQELPPTHVGEPAIPAPVPREEFANAAKYAHTITSTATTSDMWNRRPSRNASLVYRPPGADALRRYRGERHQRLPNSLRARLPRGVPSSRSIALAIGAMALLVLLGVLVESQRPEPTQSLGVTASEYAAALEDAVRAGDDDLVAALLPGAQATLDQGQRGRTTEGDLTALRHQVIAASDHLDGIARLEGPRRIGGLPGDLTEHQPRLIVAAGQVYLVAGGLFALDTDDRQLVAVQAFAGDDAPHLRSGAGDISMLAVVTDHTVVFDSEATDGLAEVPVAWPSDLPLESAFTAVFADRLYLLDRFGAGIFVVDSQSGRLSEWLTDSAGSLPQDPLGFIVDGSIRILADEGRLFHLEEGRLVGVDKIAVEPALNHPINMTVGNRSGDYYIADASVPEGRILQFDPSSLEVVGAYRLGPDAGGSLDADPHRAFANLTDLLIHEEAGWVYWIGDGAIWGAELVDEAGSGTENAGQKA
jgi:hypothetical protein